MSVLIRFLRYIVTLLIKPFSTIHEIAKDNQKIIIGLLGLSFITLIYVIAISTGLIMHNIMPDENTIFLRIPREQYYFYELFFLFPCALSGTILGSGTVRLVSMIFVGKGDFETSFALWGFIHIPVAIIMGIPDLIGNWISISPVWGWHVWLGIIVFYICAIISVREVEKLSWIKSILIALIGYMATGSVQFIFIR